MVPPSTGRILRRDWPAFGLTLFVWWLAVAVLGFLGVGLHPGAWEAEPALGIALGLVSLLVTAATSTFIGWRVRLIRQVFARGVMLEGRIVQVGENTEGIGYAVVGYRYDGREYQVRNVTEGLPRPGDLKVGAMVEVVVDPVQPSRAFLVKRYS